MQLTKRIEKELLYESILFVGGIASIVLFYRQTLLLTALLLIGWLLAILLWHTKHDLCFFVIGAIVGPVAEIVCVHYGVWRYANPTFLGIPLWLPFAWGIVGGLIKRIAQTFVKIEVRI